MSFEFDSNENIDRAEDSSDPQDVESYVGGEGLFGRVPADPKLEPPINPKANP